MEACAADIGISVVVACVVCELARGYAHGGCACAAGRRGESGGVLGVAGGSGATRGQCGEIAEGAACHIHIGRAKAGAGLAELERDGLGST